MPVTRATRKRLSDGEGRNALIIEDNEPSLLQPRPKRQRTSSLPDTAAAGTTAAAESRKGRALKPVATNANSNANSNANANSTTTKQQHQHQQQQQQHEPPAKRITRLASSAKTKPATASTTTAKTNAAASKPKAAPAAKRGRPPNATKKKATKEEEDQEQHFAAAAVAITEPSSPRATFADGDLDDDGAGGAKTAAAVAAAANAEDNNNSAAKAEDIGMPDPHREAAVEHPTSSSSSYQNGIPDDIDARDAHDPLSVTDYVADMYEHFRSKEEMCSIDCMYMGSADHGKQPNINESMRCILVDWLIEVHYKFKLFPETLYLTVNVLDRFLAQTTEEISKRDLQLVGVTALLVSAKYEEMYVPELRDLTYICDGAYTEAKILRMEEQVLKTLNYNITVPTPHTFLIRFLKAAHADRLMEQLASYLLDGTLLSLENLTCLWRPSQLAAAAILLARRQLGRHNWSPTLVSYSLYREEDVLPVARDLLKNKHRLEQNHELLALAKKYSKTKYGKVSHFTFEPLEYPEEGSGDESMEDSLL